MPDTLTGHRPTARQLAIIDLGSNTARLIVVAMVPGYSHRLVDEIREVVRLRAGLKPDGSLDDGAVQRAFATLHLFKRFCDAMKVDEIVAVATSAVRDAHNGRAFVDAVAGEIGLSLTVLSGEREAYYGTLGALNDVAMTEGYVLDIGGGSLQLSRVADRRYVDGVSLPLGALALTEQFVGNTERKIKDGEYRRMVGFLEDQVKRLPRNGDGDAVLVGMGGTIRNLAKMAIAGQPYPLNTLHGYALTLKALKDSIDALRSRTLDDRRKLPGLKEDRADIILAGALALREVMQHLSVDEIMISVGGLREGLFHERFWRHLPYPVVPDVRQFSVLNMARNYGYQQAHANQVRFLAGRLFDQMAPLHGYGPTERELLAAAALLHDLGTLVNYDDHHKHSLMLVANSGLLRGFSPREQALIGLLTRYHRKGTPSAGEFAGLLGDGDDARLAMLAALLRVAEHLERGRAGLVSDVHVRWDDACLYLTLVADRYPVVEMWDTARSAVPLLNSLCDREVVLLSTAAPDVVAMPG